jgi:hypothetical protein
MAGALNPESAVSEEQTFRSGGNGALKMKAMMEYWSIGVLGLKPITPLLHYSNSMNPTHRVPVPQV